MITEIEENTLNQALQDPDLKVTSVVLENQEEISRWNVSNDMLAILKDYIEYLGVEHHAQAEEDSFFALLTTRCKETLQKYEAAL